MLWVPMYDMCIFQLFSLLLFQVQERNWKERKENSFQWRWYSDWINIIRFNKLKIILLKRCILWVYRRNFWLIAAAASKEECLSVVFVLQQLDRSKFDVYEEYLSMWCT